MASILSGSGSRCYRAAAAKSPAEEKITRDIIYIKENLGRTRRRGAAIYKNRLFMASMALPLIFRQFRDKGRGQDEAAAHELFETVKVYNAVPEEAEASYRAAVLREYAAYCQREQQP